MLGPAMARETYRVEIEGVARELPLFEVAPDLRIAVFNLLGDTEIVEASARGLARRLEHVDHDVLVTAETKSVPLVYELARVLDRPWLVLRKQYKPYMGATITARTDSITTGHAQTLHLDEKDLSLVEGKRAVLVDDVISTGGTLGPLLRAFRTMGLEVRDIVIAVEKGDGRAALEKEHGVRIRTLERIEVRDGRVSVL